MRRRREPVSQLMVFTLEYLMEMAMNGHVRIPQYARTYVWSQDQAIALIDSVARGYPVGTLMFSEGPAQEEDVHFGPVTVHAPAETRAYWVIDGQQRLVSLVAALFEPSLVDRRFAIAYDARSDTFVADTKQHNPLVIPLPVLFDSGALTRWLSKGVVETELIEVVTDISWNIRRYQLATYVVRHEDPMVAMEVFERLNTSGVTLRASELFSALATGPGTSAKTRRVKETAYRVAEHTGFGLLDETTIVRAILATRAKDVSRIPTIPTRELQEAYDESEQPLISAVTFLQETAEVPHVSFLAYKYLLVGLTRFFAFYPSPDTRNIKLLRRWFWRATVIGTRSTGGSSTVALRTTLDGIQPGSISTTVQSMLRVVGPPPKRIQSVKKFQATTAPTRMLICSWWFQHPRDPRNGNPFTRSELSQALGNSTSAGRVLPTILRGGKSLSSMSANHLLLPIADESIDELDSLLSEPRIGANFTEWLNVLGSHAITGAAAELLRQGDTQGFLDIRESIIDNRYREFINSVCEWQFEDTPSLSDLVIDDDDDEYYDDLD